MSDYNPAGTAFAQRFTLALMKRLRARVQYLTERAPGGWQILRYHPQYAAVIKVCGIAFVPLIAMCWVGEVPLGLRLAGTVTFGAMLAYSMVALRIYRRCTIAYSELGIECVPLLAKPFVFGWDQITEVVISIDEESCVVRANDGRKMRVNAMMNGFGKFIDDARRKLGMA